MSQLVIRHPDVADPGMCSQEQFDVLYAGKGWEIADIDPQFAAGVLGETLQSIDQLDLDQLRRVVAAHDAAAQKPIDRKADLLKHKADELRDLAEAQGLETDGTKDEVADRIIEHEKSLLAS